MRFTISCVHNVTVVNEFYEEMKTAFFSATLSVLNNSL